MDNMIKMIIMNDMIKMIIMNNMIKMITMKNMIRAYLPHFQADNKVFELWVSKPAKGTSLLVHCDDNLSMINDNVEDRDDQCLLHHQ